MTSKRKIAANRNNSRYSRGPASAAGKKIASRNALRHGLTAIAHHAHMPSFEIDRIGKVLCGNDDDPELVEAALNVAESEMSLRAIRQQKLAAVERLRDVTAIALAKGDNSLVVGRARSMQSWLISRDLERLVPKLMQKYKDKMAPPLQVTSTDDGEFPWLEFTDDMVVPIRLKALLEPEDSEPEDSSNVPLPSSAPPNIEIEERDEHEVLTEALPDLIKLDRYEQRALSRQRHALRQFMSVKLMQRLNAARRARAAASGD